MAEPITLKHYAEMADCGYRLLREKVMTEAVVDLEKAHAQLAHARHFVQRIRFTQYVGEIRHGELDEAELGEKMAASGAEFDKTMEDTANGLYDNWVSNGAGRDHDFVAEFERLKGKRDG